MNSTTLNDAPRLTTSDVVTEGFILLAMALVTLALGTGLFLQFNLGFVAAVICALSVYLGLLATHALVHRNSAVTELKTELSNLEKQFTRAIGRGDGSQKNEKSQSKITPTVASVLPETLSINASMNTTAQPIVPSQTPPDLSVLAPVATKDAAQATATQEDIMNAGIPSEDDVPTVPIFKSSTPDQKHSKPVSLATQRALQETPSEQLTPPPAPPSSRPPRESDVDMIKGLIKKLADEVNATNELPNLDDQNDLDTPPVAHEEKTGPTPLAKQSLDFSKLMVPPSDEPTLDRDTENTPELKTERDQDMAGDLPEKKSNGPVSLASQVISRQSSDTPQEDQERQDHDVSEQTQVTEDTQPAQNVSDQAIEVSLNALRTTAKAMRGQEPSMPAEENQHDDILPQIEPTPFDPIVNETPTDFETRDEIDEKLVGLSQGTPEAANATPTGPGVFAIISEALSAGRVDVLLDPILGLENRRAQHFEISVRLRDIDNTVINTKEHCENFVGSGLETMLDRETLSRTATVALQLDSRGRHGAVFSKVAAESFSAEEFIDDVYAAFQARSTLSSQLVMTLTQEHVRRLGVSEWTTLADLKTLGFRFALSSVTDLDMDFEDLSEKGYTFVKLDADVFLNGLQAGQVRIPTDDICNHLASMGITAIVDRIENDTVLGQLRDLGVQFGQGQLFGGPRTVKAQALKTTTGNAA